MKLNHWLLSICLVAALAATGSASAHDGNGYNKDGDGSSQHMEWHKSKLPEEKRQLLHDTMHAALEKNKGLFDQMHKLHQKLHSILSADTFDSKAFLVVTSQIEKMHDRIHEVRARAFVSIAGQFTPQEREMIAKWHHHHHHHHEHDGMDYHYGDGNDHSTNEGSSSQQQDSAYPPYPTR